jgi:hypothetical protein
MLFKYADLTKDLDSISKVFQGKGNAQLSKGASSLKKFMPEIKQDHVYHYVTRARWSMHDLLGHLLSFTGPADVYFTTWSITMGPASQIMELKKAGLIRDLYAIIDSRVKTNSPEAHQFLMMNCKALKLAKIHAKVLVIKNEFNCASVLSSQNFTNVKRIEAGTIDTHEQIALQHIEWIKSKINEPDARINQRGTF